MPTHRHRRQWTAMAATALALLTAPAAAQTQTPAPADPRSPPRAPGDRPDCQATTPGAGMGDRNLSDTLRECGGALAPPPSGDREMTVTPPEGSRTPVIRPDRPGERVPQPEPRVSP